MVNDQMETWADRFINDIAHLSVFGNIRRMPLIASLYKFLIQIRKYDSELDSSGRFDESWAIFMEQFARGVGEGAGSTFATQVATLTLYDDNPFTRAAAASDAQETDALLGISPILLALAGTDLFCLADLARLNVEALTGDFPLITHYHSQFFTNDKKLPVEFFTAGEDWSDSLKGFIQFLRQNGAGDFARRNAFVWQNGELRAAASIDPVRLKDLSGYEGARKIVVDNTMRFLAGAEANNILLYGDRGTGKSATIKAVCNEFPGQGLRVIEVMKDSLAELPLLLNDFISSSPKLKFIIFIDDLSFENAGAEFTALKALLEGGIEERPSNVVVYATSNRRHLVKEKFSDRPAGGGIGVGSEADVRAEDSMQEQLSLADRFGVTVVFGAPTQDEYLKIARFIAEERGVLNVLTTSDAEIGEFERDALRWEKWYNGRSPRTAKQFVLWLEAHRSGTAWPWEG
jgi:predicted AAA+ superfamily ATPase